MEGFSPQRGNGLHGNMQWSEAMSYYAKNPHEAPDDYSEQRERQEAAEAKASKNEDKQTMMQKKNETEQIINKALLKGKKL